jgi:hypothetical protein
MAEKKMSTGKKIVLAILAIFIIIQFIRPARNQSQASPATNIFTQYPASDHVKQMISVACNDCHSDSTRYPWYANIQPVGWWLGNHISEGKRELNFSEFGTYTPKRQNNKLGKIAEEVKEKGMPLDSYTWIHKDARLTDAEREEIIAWADGAKKQLNYK